MKKTKVNYKETGITLVALVVTIIVLLILAGVTLTLALSNNGVMDKAQYASNTWANATADEQAMMERIASDIDSLKQGGGSTNTDEKPTLASVVAQGDYVDINIHYFNQQGFQAEFTTNGWRVLDKDDTLGTVRLIATAHPLSFCHPGNESLTSIQEMRKIITETINVDSESTRGYTRNGFSTNDVKGLFNNSSVFSELTLPVKADIEAISENSDLRVTGEPYWLAEQWLENHENYMWLVTETR